MKTLRRSGLLIVTVVVALLAAPLFGMGAPALAQCSQTGSSVDCTGTDSDGFQTAGTVQVTVQAGATVNNSANAPTDTLLVGPSSTVTNNGSLAATGSGGAAVFAYPNSTVDNNGTITTTGDSASISDVSAGIYVVNNGTVINDGTITTGGVDATGVASLGSGNNITNNGTITTSGASSDAVQVTNIGGNVAITNTGNLNAAGDGIETRGAATTLNNSGTITGGQYGILTSVVAASNDTIVTSGTVTGGTAAINTGGGDDSVELTGNAPVVNGNINGGAGTDTLIFSFDVLDTDYATVSAAIAAAAPAGGSLSYNGQTYSWLNFEQLVNLLNQVASGGGGGTGGGTGGSTVVVVAIGGIGDGRLNGMDLAATAIAYCSTGGTGLDLYAVTGGGVEFVFNADQAAIEAALAAASGAAAQVVPASLAPAAEAFGVSLFATDSTHLQVFGPDGYTFGFEANVCGLG